MASKARLKEIREAIAKKDFQSAKRNAEKVLDFEPANYNASVFLGLANLELGNYPQAEAAYQAAIEASPEQPLAWQGLSQFYERTSNLGKQSNSLFHLARIWNTEETASKCLETIEKIAELSRKTDSQIETLLQFLPGGEFSSILPDTVSLRFLVSFVSLIEKEDADKFDKELSRRRTRLDASRLSKSQLEKEVGCAIWVDSKLPSFYKEVLAHPIADEKTRREAEAKLLRFQHRLLLSLPETLLERKNKLRQTVLEMVDGMILLKIPDSLACEIYLNTQNIRRMIDYKPILLTVQDIRPDSIDSRIGKMWLLLLHTAEGGAADPEQAMSLCDGISDLAVESNLSVFAHRAVSDAQAYLSNFGEAILSAESGLSCLKKWGGDFGAQYTETQNGLNLALATSLVRHYPPRYHARAIKIFDELLRNGNDDLEIWLGKAYIAQWAENWSEALRNFDRVLQVANHSETVASEAREGIAWAQVHGIDIEQGLQTLQSISDQDFKSSSRPKSIKARLFWKLGQAFLKHNEGNREAAHKSFITSLRHEPTFAPSFTSLGMHYSSNGDNGRATKCFQKAFELDAREVQAAKMLAESFAREEEWELLAVVVERLIKGEGSQVGQGISISQNSWAWKALGVVELARGEWNSAAQCFQDILRLNTNDCLSWTCLGEAYARTGRWEASLKSLARAREIEPDNWLPIFILGEVQIQVGLFESAVDSYTIVLSGRDDEAKIGARQSLADAFFAMGKGQQSQGFLARAEYSLLESLDLSKKNIESKSGHRRLAWKSTADSLFALGQLGVFQDKQRIRSNLKAINSYSNSSSLDSDLLEALGPPVDIELGPLTEIFAKLAIIAFNLHFTLSETEAAESQSMAAFDLATSIFFLGNVLNSPDEQTSCRTQAIRFAKRAVRLDPSFEQAWILLGDLHRLNAPQVAQHAYIQALEINRSSAKAWCRLGFLYLKEESTELAKHAFLEAQVCEPAYSPAWIGHGIIAQKQHRNGEADSIWSYAAHLEGSQDTASLHFCERYLKQTRKTNVVTSADDHGALLIVDSHLQKTPNNPTALHLKALLLERLGHLSLALEAVLLCNSLLEEAYEESEDPEVAWRYCIAQATCARLHLKREGISESLETFETVLSLVPDSHEGRKGQIEMQSILGMAIAWAKRGSEVEALEMMEKASKLAQKMEVYQPSVDVIGSQVGWTLGKQELAQSFLLNSSQLSSIPVVTMVAAFGLVTGDHNLIDAALEEIIDQATDQWSNRDPSGRVTYLLSLNSLVQGDPQGAISVLQKRLRLQPDNSHLRSELAELITLAGSAPISAALLSFGDTSETTGRLEVLRAVVSIKSNEGTREPLQRAQRCVFLSPGSQKSWCALVYAKLFHL